MSTCIGCKKPAVETCTNCKQPICDDSDCGQDTVDGFMCGSYTQWGCSRKYTTCDECLEDKAIHEGDFNECEKCSLYCCDKCLETHECESEESTD